MEQTGKTGKSGDETRRHFADSLEKNSAFERYVEEDDDNLLFKTVTKNPYKSSDSNQPKYKQQNLLDHQNKSYSSSNNNRNNNNNNNNRNRKPKSRNNLDV